MKEFDEFSAAVQAVGTSVADMKDKATALKTAVDAKVAQIGQDAAQDTAITPVGAA